MAGFTTPPSFVSPSRDHVQVRVSIIIQLKLKFYWLRKQEYLEKTTDLSQITDKLSHNVVLSTPWHEHGSNLQL
jgi:hypothetical protein